MWLIALDSFKMCNTSELDQVKLLKKTFFIESLYAIDASINLALSKFKERIYNKYWDEQYS